MVDPHPRRRPPAGRIALEECELMLQEYAHRTSEELAGVIAALRIAPILGGRRPRERLALRTVRRIEALADRHRMLAMPIGGTVEMSAAIEALCRSIAASLPGSWRSTIELDLARAPVSGAVARRLCVVAADLIGEAAAEALIGRRGVLTVKLGVVAETVELSVRDDRLRWSAWSPADGRRAVVMELVALVGGSIGVAHGPDGTFASVSMPLTDEFSSF